MTTRERIEQRVFALRCDDRFDDLLTERLSRSPEVNKLVLTGKVDVEALREFALHAIEVAFIREADAQHELPEARYEEHVEALVKAVGENDDAKVEQREAFRAWFRYAHATLRNRMARPVAWRALARIAPHVMSALDATHRAVLPLLTDGGDDA